MLQDNHQLELIRKELFPFIKSGIIDIEKHKYYSFAFKMNSFIKPTFCEIYPYFFLHPNDHSTSQMSKTILQNNDEINNAMDFGPTTNIETIWYYDYDNKIHNEYRKYLSLSDEYISFDSYRSKIYKPQSGGQ